MIQRPEYLKKLSAFKDRQLVKIVTGIRRCGKSTLFKLYQEALLQQGVAPRQIQTINLEDVDNEHLLDYKALHAHIKKHLVPNRQNYIFLDEVQNVACFEKAVRSLFDKGNTDIYLTGSNSKLQSGEWATSLAGRHVEIHVFPLSFKEYVSAATTQKTTITTSGLDPLYAHYTGYGGFPYTLQFRKPGANGFEWDAAAVRDYLSGIYNSIVLKDVAESKNFKDLGRLERVLKCMAGNIGSETSIKKISDTMTSDGMKILPPLVESYLDAFRSSYVLYRADRYDVKGKKLLKTLNKFYLVDAGLRRLLLGNKAADTGFMLENVVYLELLRRGHNVYIGKVGEREVDFVVEGANGIEYYQVAETVRAKETLARELAALDAIKDHHPKFLLTRDYESVNHNGIQQRNVLEWLAGDS